MPEPRSEVWAGVPGHVVESESQTAPSAPTNKAAANPYKTMIIGQVAFGLCVAVVTVVAWTNVIQPVIEKVSSPYEEMASKVSADAAELQAASDKNCKREGFNLRGCTAVWAHVRIPSVSETANVSVPH